MTTHNDEIYFVYNGEYNEDEGIVTLLAKPDKQGPG